MLGTLGLLQLGEGGGSGVQPLQLEERGVVEGAGGQLPQVDVWGSVVGLLELDVGGSDVELL